MKAALNLTIRIFLLCLFLASFNRCAEKKAMIGLSKDREGNILITNEKIRIKLDRLMYTTVFLDGTLRLNRERSESQNLDPSYYLISGDGKIKDFVLIDEEIKEENIETELGSGKRFMLRGTATEVHLDKILHIEMYEKYPEAAVVYAEYENTGDAPIKITASYSNCYELDASLVSDELNPTDLWTHQGSALGWGKDYIFRIPRDFSRENYMGYQQRSRIGGGVPVFDYWTPQMGIAIGHIEPVPQLVSFPAIAKSGECLSISMKEDVNMMLEPGQTFKTIRSLLVVHHLDFFEPLRVFSSMMADQGLKMKEPSPDAYEPIWCGWGYRSDFTMDDIYNTLPKLKKLKLDWVVIDDRWFDKYGDWNPRKETFPGGEEQLKAFVDSLHKEGFKVKIWWAPTNAQPENIEARKLSFDQGISSVAKEHPEWLIMDEEGNYPRDERQMYLFCPSVKKVQDYIKNLTVKFIRDWGFDGHKLDAFWVPPPCYNPAHHHAKPEESYEDTYELIRIVHETSRELKSHSVTEVCNCGTPQDFYQIIHTDQPVTSDPVSAEQVRKRIKVYKALYGPSCAAYGDHAELTLKGKDPQIMPDLASTIAIGGVPGTKFTWPAGPDVVRLTEDKENIFNMWLDIYSQHMLSEGTYLNLYDFAWDKPETHVIQKGDTLFYGFFSEHWEGPVTLRGLEVNRAYGLVDYVNNIDIGSVSTDDASIEVEFDHHLTLKATPK